jgi:hypothetical protein
MWKSGRGDVFSWWLVQGLTFRMTILVSGSVCVNSHGLF